MKPPSTGDSAASYVVPRAQVDTAWRDKPPADPSSDKGS
jgi:hypothetical protein